MAVQLDEVSAWVKERIKEEEITKYLASGGRDFIPDGEIEEKLRLHENPDSGRIREIFAKALSIETLTPDETAALIHVKDEALLAEMRETALKIKKKVYDNRIVTFAPLYIGNYCVNDCLYCGFRSKNKDTKRSILSLEAVRKEAEILAGKIGHKRLIVVFGEHPDTGVDYMIDTIKTIYDVKVKARVGFGNIRRINVNAAPMPIDELRRLNAVGIGTYQVFQETYHHGTYAKLHPKGTLKANYAWRLYCMHRALEAGIDDVGIGALFGLYDWRFEVMGLLYHSRELEAKFGVGPHTISFPRLEPAFNTPYAEKSSHKVSYEDFKKIITVLRLAVPHAGMIVTARENATVRRESIALGITQTDASTRIGIGAYSASHEGQEGEKQQFFLGDTRSLDEVVRELAQMGFITSFCTAGYRCGRTGKCIMELLKTGQEGKFCKLNAVLTYREWLDDFASEETRKVGETVLEKEIVQIREGLPAIYPKFMEYYERIRSGERDLYF